MSEEITNCMLVAQQELKEVVNKQSSSSNNQFPDNINKKENWPLEMDAVFFLTRTTLQ